MNAEQFNSLLLQKEFPVTEGTDELLQLGKQYPWFGAAHVLSAVQLHQQGDERADASIQKALLYVQDPLHLQYILNQFNRDVRTTQEDILSSPHTDEDIILNADATVDSADELLTTVDEETDAALDATALVEATDAIATSVDEETEAAINAEVLIEASVESQEKIFTPLSSILKEPLKEGEDKLSFEPLHTVDYFASQGIKLREDMLQKDKLGQQLKTFTQWLKTMKKVSPEDTGNLDKKTEEALVQMAGESNTGEEIVTESMALVLEQQGKTAKAIELYRKLSLLHPEKSVYFAAQIERLNN